MTVADRRVEPSKAKNAGLVGAAWCGEARWGSTSLGCVSRRSCFIVDDPPARSPICRRLEQCPVVRTSPRCPPLVVYPPYRRTTFFFAYHLSPASTSRLLSVSFTIGRLLPGAPCFAAVDICLSYNPGSPCFLSAPLIHPSTPLCILLSVIILSQARSQPCTILVPVNRLHSAPRIGSLPCEPCCCGCTPSTTPNPCSTTTVSSAAAYFVVSLLGFLAGMRPVCSPTLGDIRSMPYALMLSSRHSPSRACLVAFQPSNPRCLGLCSFTLPSGVHIACSMSHPHPSEQVAPAPLARTLFIARTYLYHSYLSARIAIPSRPIPPSSLDHRDCALFCFSYHTRPDFSRFRSPLCP